MLNETPIPPKGGWAQGPDKYARCPKTECGYKGPAGEHIGTMLSRITIKAYQPGTKPYIDLAHMIRCMKCGYIDRVYLLHGPQEEDENGYTGKRLPGEAEKLGITKQMIVAAYAQMAVDMFSLDELRSGVVRGGKKRTIDYDPDKYVEPTSHNQEEIF